MGEFGEGWFRFRMVLSKDATKVESLAGLIERVIFFSGRTGLLEKNVGG